MSWVCGDWVEFCFFVFPFVFVFRFNLGSDPVGSTMARRNACGSPPAHRSVGDGVEIEASLVVGVGVGSVVGLVCLLLFCWFPGEGKFFIFHVFFSFLRSFSIFFVLSTIYYRYCNIILLKLGLNFPRSGGGGASRAGKNPKRPTLFEKSRDPRTTWRAA